MFFSQVVPELLHTDPHGVAVAYSKFSANSRSFAAAVLPVSDWPRTCTAVVRRFAFIVTKVTTVAGLVMVCCVFSQLTDCGSITVSVSGSSIFVVFKKRPLHSKRLGHIELRPVCYVQ
jgi:hypothetical protein